MEMNVLSATLLQAAPTGGGNFLLTIVPFALVFVVFYFLMIRPQNKKRKETQKMIDNVKKGDKIITIGGLHAEVASVREKTVLLKLDDSSKAEYSKSAIASVVPKYDIEESSSEPPK